MLSHLKLTIIILKTEYELLKDRSHPVFLCCMKAIVTLE